MSIMRTMTTRDVTSGASAPLGATVLPGGVNFSVFSKHAVLLELLLFDDENASQPARIVPLDAIEHRTHHYWHVFVPALEPGQVYAYRAHGPYELADGLRFDGEERENTRITWIDRAVVLTGENIEASLAGKYGGVDIPVDLNGGLVAGHCVLTLRLERVH